MNVFLAALAPILLMAGQTPTPPVDMTPLAQTSRPADVDVFRVTMGKLENNRAQATDASGTSMYVQISSCRVKYRTGETWYLLSSARAPIVVGLPARYLDIAIKLSEGDWDTAIALVAQAGHLCVIAPSQIE